VRCGALWTRLPHGRQDLHAPAPVTALPPVPDRLASVQHSALLVLTGSASPITLAPTPLYEDKAMVCSHDDAQA
jgi:hypothetical protein